MAPTIKTAQAKNYKWDIYFVHIFPLFIIKKIAIKIAPVIKVPRAKILINCGYEIINYFLPIQTPNHNDNIAMKKLQAAGPITWDKFCPVRAGLIIPHQLLFVFVQQKNSSLPNSSTRRFLF